MWSIPTWSTVRAFSCRPFPAQSDLEVPTRSRYIRAVRWKCNRSRMTCSPLNEIDLIIDTLPTRPMLRSWQISGSTNESGIFSAKSRRIELKFVNSLKEFCPLSSATQKTRLKHGVSNFSAWFSQLEKFPSSSRPTMTLHSLIGTAIENNSFLRKKTKTRTADKRPFRDNLLHRGEIWIFFGWKSLSRNSVCVMIRNYFRQM